MKTYKEITLSIICLFNLSIATVIDVPADQPTIQQGIDVTVESDTVLVQPGRYVENINFNGKNYITLASLEMITGDESYINSTIIDGNKTGSCIRIGDESEQGIVIQGFRITNGSGDYFNDDPLGGGLVITNESDVSIISCRIDHNDARIGGGIFIGESHLLLSNVSITDNIGKGIQGHWYPEIVFDTENKCNVYHNYPIDIYVAFAGGLHGIETIDVVLDTFTVLNPTGDYFVIHDDNTILTLDIENGSMELVDNDLFVSSSGDDSNSGLSEEAPLKNIEWAIQKIESDSINPNTVFVDSGVYSSDTGQIFPIRMKPFMSLIGNNRETTIIENKTIHTSLTNSIYNLNTNSISRISDLTITGYSKAMHFCYTDSVYINNLTIRDVLDSLDFDDHFMVTFFYEVGFLECDSLSIINTETTDELGNAGIEFDHGNAQLSNCLFENNRVKYYGAGGYSSCYFIIDDSLTIENSIFRNSLNYLQNPEQENAGGSVFVVASRQFCTTRLLLSNSLIHNNTTNFYKNFNISTDYKTVFNCTFAGNDSELSTLLSSRGRFEIYNSIFYNSSDYQIHLPFWPNTYPPARELYLSHSLIKNGIDGICNEDPWTGECNTENSQYNYDIIWLEGNIDTDPMFNNPARDDYTLRSNSACINTGTLDLPVGITLPEFDLAGNPRVVNGRVDMGAFEFQGTVDNNYQSSIVSYQLLNASPNPFNPITVINYQLPAHCSVLLDIYNVNGQLVEELVSISNKQKAGYHSLVWDATRYPSGVYFVKLVAGGFTDSQKILLVK